MSMTDKGASCHTDVCPNTPRAGKVIPPGHRVVDCLQDTSMPSTPPVVQKFRSKTQPEPGAIRVHRGRANDPDVAGALVHGISTKLSGTQGDSILNPQPNTFFQQKLQEQREAIYASTQKAPLGRSHKRHSGVSNHYSDKTTFGVKTVRDLDGGEIINPPKTVEDLEKEAQEGHEAYVRSHNAYFAGEQVDRKYDKTHYSRNSVFGIATPHFSDGRTLGKTLQWLGETTKFPVWKRSNSAETPTGEVNHINPFDGPEEMTFGQKLTASSTVGEILHSTISRVDDPWCSLVYVVQHHLKKFNFLNFPSLLQAFKHYDKGGKGMIDQSDLQEMCRQSRLNVSEPILDKLMEYCDIDRDGFLNFLEFANFLNFKDKMPLKRSEQILILNESQTSTAAVNVEAKSSLQLAQVPDAKPLITPEDLVPVEPDSSLKTVRTLRRPTDVSNYFTTSSAVIGAVSDVPFTANSRTFGIPSVRTDLPVPRIKKIGDSRNYSNSASASELLQPSIYGQWGVHEQQFCPRSKTEIAEIFKNVGLNISDETFEKAWKLASMRRPDGEVSVEVFRSILKEIKAM